MGQRRILAALIAVLLAVGTWSLLPALGHQTRVVAAITVFAGVLWFAEVIPLWVTALLVPALLITGADITPEAAFTPFFHPVNAVMLGGFVLGLGVQRHGLDTRLVRLFARVSGDDPRFFLLGMMAVTAFLSFWISNTAAAALLMPVGVTALTASNIPRDAGYTKAMVLGIGYAATIGGVGTLVGTPPNLIAAGYLADAGVQLTFAGWMVRVAPLVVVMVPAAWLVVMWLYGGGADRIRLPDTDSGKWSRTEWYVVAVCTATAGLWLTEPLHGIDTAAVAMLPVVALFGGRVLDSEAIREIHWEVLLLIGGGMTLGRALTATGIDRLLADQVVALIGGYPRFMLFVLLGVFGIGLTMFVANTAAAALLIPVMLPVAETLGIDPLVMSMVIGVVVSFDFIVPVGTPPSAIAYGTGYIDVQDMIKAGIGLSLLGALVVALAALMW